MFTYKNKIILWFFILLSINIVYADFFDNLSHAYAFNESSGSLIDYADNNGDASTVSGCTREVAGKNGFAYSFDGNDYILGNSLSAGLKYTICAWWLTDEMDADDVKPLMSQDDSGNNVGDWIVGINSYVSSPEHPFYMETNAGGGAIQVYSNVKPRADEWYLTCFEYGQAGMKMYINGTLQTDTDADTTVPKNSQLALGVYFSNGGFDFYLEGDIDEIYIWNRSLSIDEHSELWANGDGFFFPFETPSVMTLSNYKDNSSKLSENGTNVQLNISITGDANINYAWLETNMTGVYINISPVAINNPTPVIFSYNMTISNPENIIKTIGVKFWANATDESVESSALFSFIIYPHCQKWMMINSTSGVIIQSIDCDGNSFFLGNITANDYSDNTPGWGESSLSALQKVSYIKSIKKDNIIEIDHTTLPNIAQVKNKDGSIHRSLSGMITILTESVKSLYSSIIDFNSKISRLENESVVLNSKIKNIEFELCKNQNNYTWCKQ